MAFCMKCGTEIKDGIAFCPECGTPMLKSAEKLSRHMISRDHTDEFEAEDISNNKVWAMLAYLFGIIGVLLALIAGTMSPYARFHATQSVKIFIVTSLGTLAIGIVAGIIGGIAIALAGMYGYYVMIPLMIVFAAFEICMLVLVVMCFIQVCRGKAKDIPLVGTLGFLR